MTISKTLPAIFSILALSACVSDTAEDESSERAPIGKSDLVGSCADSAGGDFCGGASDGNCWCDDLCESIGDCCSDKAPVCDGIPECEAAGGTCFGGTVNCDAVESGATEADLDCGGTGGPPTPQLTCCLPPQQDCPTTCGEYCTMAADCTLPDGCENPGCGCPEAICESECETAGGTCFGGTVNCEVIEPGTSVGDLDCGGSGPISPQQTCCLPNE